MSSGDCAEPVGNTYLVLIFFLFWLYKFLVHLGESFNVGEPVDEERVLCVKWVPVHDTHSVHRVVGRLELHEDEATEERGQQELPMVEETEIGLVPLALACLVVPWHEDVLWLDVRTSLSKLIADIGEELLKL